MGVIRIQMVGDIETGNNVTKGGSVKGKKEGTQDKTRPGVDDREHSAISTNLIPEAVNKNVVVSGIKCC